MAKAVGNDGWTSTQGPDGAVLHVRARERDGRLVITDLYLHAAEITPTAMRGVSISRLEAELNAATHSEPGPDSGVTVFSRVAADLARSSGDEPEPTLAELRARIPADETAHPQRPRLTRPDGAAPEEFYPRVARAYFEYAPRTRAPAKEIADEASVPVTTAHRWIREARRRGFLPPARKGKAG